jgi:hypothetical protein
MQRRRGLADRDADGYRDRGRLGDRLPHPDSKCVAIRDAERDCHQHGHADDYPDADDHPHADGHADADPVLRLPEHDLLRTADRAQHLQ